MTKDFSDLLESVRIRNGWTQEYLAYMLGYSASHISKILRGDNSVTIGFINQVIGPLNISRYQALVSFYRNSAFVKLGVDVRGEFIPESVALRAVEGGNYQITTYWPSFLSYRYLDKTDSKNIQWEFKDLTDLSTETGISQERLKEIFDCYYIRCAPVKVEETIRLCKALDKSWHELFALTCYDLQDEYIVNVAVTVDRYVEHQRRKRDDRFQQLPVNNLSEEEAAFLLEMLKTYRKLHLAPVMK
ncbi:helix-turn-helix transcriptional regulator [Paenibacillus sp. G2S3]|uniref:helix-turn-helix domain-containing protein n=1 Tax=Paenibacillus sp. G2S3 TaxID=3047872 RepID=UPI0024C13BE7|nr:helix-turn-helix transcriptional regulator [Paenibacillus sp. G2S3]WHY20088.1 helix-turn-helix transcriptional regulator [Paenibacillus sp. G2S3]